MNVTWWDLKAHLDLTDIKKGWKKTFKTVFYLIAFQSFSFNWSISKFLNGSKNLSLWHLACVCVCIYLQKLSVTIIFSLQVSVIATNLNQDHSEYSNCLQNHSTGCRLFYRCMLWISTGFPASRWGLEFQNDSLSPNFQDQFPWKKQSFGR